MLNQPLHPRVNQGCVQSFSRLMSACETRRVVSYNSRGQQRAEIENDRRRKQSRRKIRKIVSKKKVRSKISIDRGYFNLKASLALISPLREKDSITILTKANGEGGTPSSVATVRKIVGIEGWRDVSIPTGHLERISKL